jgi:hypothetical protein
MKLSEAILLGSLTGPQTVGRMFGPDNSSCAIGAAVLTVTNTRDADEAWRVFRSTWRWVSLWQIFLIIVRNDYRGWNRGRIAEWISQIEPKSLSTTKCDALLTRHAEDEGQLCGKQCSPGKFLCDEHYVE